MKFLIPKLFLCRYPLKFGANIVSITMCFYMLAWCIVAIIQVIMMDDCTLCHVYPWRIAYGLSVTACLYCFIMLAVNIWLFWGIKHGKSSVVVGWVVVTGIWLVQSFVIIIVLLCIYSAEVSIVAWLLCLILACICYGILLYGCFVIYGYWIELKESRREAVNNSK